MKVDIGKAVQVGDLKVTALSMPSSPVPVRLKIDDQELTLLRNRRQQVVKVFSDKR